MIISDLISLPTPQLSGGQIHNLGGKGKRKELAEGCKCVWHPRSRHPKVFLHKGLMLFMLIAMIKKHKSWNISAILSCFDLVQKVTFFLVVKWPSKRHPQTWNELRFLLMKLRVYWKQASWLYLLPTFLLPLCWTYFKPQGEGCLVQLYLSMLYFSLLKAWLQAAASVLLKPIISVLWPVRGS